MYQKLFLLILAIATEATDLKLIKPHVTPSKLRIIGGQEVEPHSVPFQVGLWINGNAFCSGSLISPNYVLTAAHCGIVISSVNVVLGAHNISNSDEETQIRIKGADVILHEEYNTSNYRNDIALIKLSEAAPINDYIQIVKLPPKSDSSKDYYGDSVTATGWGLPKDVPFPSTKDMSDVLLGVELQVSNFTECADYFNDNEDTYVVDSNICTSGYKNKGTCDGDSGGPLTEAGVLIGITSFGDTLCELCTPSVYTKVASYLEWISEHSDVEIL